MPLSDATLREIAKVLRKHVAPRTLEQIAAELVEIRGDKDFRATIENLVNALGLTSGRRSVTAPVDDRSQCFARCSWWSTRRKQFFQVSALIFGGGD